MEFATGALGTLLPKLGKLLQDEYNLQKGVKKDIEFVKREVDSMRAALCVVGEVPREQLNDAVKIWSRDVRELSYDMEDIVDTFLVRVQASEPPSKRSIKRFVKKITGIMSKAKTHHVIGQEIKNIKERVKEVAVRRDRYKVDAISPTKTWTDPRITALYTKEANLVGIDEPREELISMLTKEDGGISAAEQRIISIVGFGGLGKTTLAKAVYNKIKPGKTTLAKAVYNKNKPQFSCTAFVSVSRDPDIIKILKDMLYELDKKEYKDIHIAALGQQHLTDLVQEFLKNRRYLIVIDDIWEKKPWEMIRCALPDNGLKSRVVTTTRIMDVAEHVGGFYRMKHLSSQSSEILFYGRIFDSKGNWQQFSAVSEKVLKKCRGVPLAIVTISSLLANKSRNVNEWYDLCDAIGAGVGNNPNIDEMRKILLLSYYDLTPQLKTCLLYLSLFPEDYEIEKNRLILRWMSEGFIKQEDGRQSLFEIGQNYFNELLNRSLIQPGNIDDNDMAPLSCRVHDMVLDLICSLSRDECFATTINRDCNQITSSEGRVRRLSIHNTTWHKMDMSTKLRSLTINNPVILNSMPPISSIYLLRVLDLHDCNLKDHPSLDFVRKLLHLRYLSLAGTGYAGDVPREIGKLQFLQTLNFFRTDIKELPLSIFGLRQLLSLLIGNSSRLPATSGLRNLSSLELLRMIVDSAYIAEELGHLTQLRVLVVMLKMDEEGRWDESMCRALMGSLRKLHKIQTLVIISDDMEVDLEGSVDSLWNLSHLCIYGASRLPTWIDPTSFLLLSRLYIRNVGQVRSGDIHVLGTLQALCVLEVNVAGTKQVFERFMISTGAFPCVTRCEFSGFSIMPSMFPSGAMPRLQRFKFDIRPEDFSGSEFNVDDLSLSHLPSLQAVRVRLVGEDTVSEEMAMKVKEALRNEARAHPNHPDTDIRIHDEWIPLPKLSLLFINYRNW